MDILKKIFFFCVVCGAGVLVGYKINVSPAPEDFTVLYSLDKKQNDQALVDAVDGAQTYVYFAIYEFTKENIADALIGAKEKGLDVEGIMDAGQSQDGAQANIVNELKTAGIPVEFQKHPKGIMHMKLLVTDNAYALGSYNWTESATALNDEILEIGTAEPLREKYLDVIKRVLAANR
ncbi:MAG: phospholipase D-like domain-containing protein [Minisyncoccia bacterium]|jgi:phosphatidylserine/phosphatidylglycerophosphate/cardiolipin synthase-like enzyme